VLLTEPSIQLYTVGQDVADGIRSLSHLDYLIFKIIRVTDFQVPSRGRLPGLRYKTAERGSRQHTQQAQSGTTAMAWISTLARFSIKETTCTAAMVGKFRPQISR
jgi:hypothetical protein